MRKFHLDLPRRGKTTVQTLMILALSRVIVFAEAAIVYAEIFLLLNAAHDF